jgi:hypothetical protein
VEIVFRHASFEMGDGSKIKFWDDMWCGEMTLEEAFPNLYNFAHVKDAFVAIYMDFSSGSLQWNVRFTHTAHNWEVDVLASFYTLLYSHSVRREGKNKLRWAPFHKILACKEAFPFPWKRIWQTKVLLKVAFFAWSAAQGKILTMDNFRKKHVIVFDRCCLRKQNGNP